MSFKVIKVAGDLSPLSENCFKELAAYPDGQQFELVPVNVTPEKQRTTTQNKAKHKYFELLAVALNDAGLDMRKVLKEGVDIPWNKDAVKEHLWRPIQKVITGKASTTELTTAEPSEIYNVLSRHISYKFGINIPWPSKRSN